MVGRVRIRTHTKLMDVLQTLGLTHAQPTHGLRGRICAGKPEGLSPRGMHSRHTEKIGGPARYPAEFYALQVHRVKFCHYKPKLEVDLSISLSSHCFADSWVQLLPHRPGHAAGNAPA